MSMKIQIFNNPKFGDIQGYLDAAKTAWLKVEGVARGLGFTTVATSGNVCVRWARVNEYLKSFGYPKEVGKDDFIPENMVYRLAMKANNETAEEFQAWLADEVVPQIRKTGKYSLENNLELPQLPPIVPLFYKGERILTTRQIAELFKVSESAVKHSYGRHKSVFEKDVDFYDLRGNAFEDFRVENFNRPGMGEPKVTKGTATAVTTGTKPVSFYIQGSVLKIWTKSGVFKLSKYIHSDNAKLIYVSVAQGYFQIEPENLPVVEKQENFGASVYIFEMSNGTVKIGISNNVPYRVKAVEGETHLKVMDIYYRAVESRKKALAIETALHNYFAAQCVQGEYFLIDFEEACTQIKIMLDLPKNPLNPAEQILELLKSSTVITDEKLRDEIIRETAKLIFNREF